MHPELERLERDFGWKPESVTTWDEESRIWVDSRRAPDKSVYLDETWQSMDSLLDESWWYRTRNLIILRSLDRTRLGETIWDIGGGTGVVSRFLASHQHSVIGVEPSRAGAVLAARRGVHSFCSTLEDLQLPNESIKALSLFDVLEHIDDRARTLRDIHRVLEKEGILILTLPALESLWSQFDVDGGHHLRYNKRTIQRELEGHGFEVTRLGYFFVFTVAPLFLLRVLPYRLGARKAVAAEATLGASGGLVGKLAAWFERTVALRSPIGSSLLVIAQKK